MKQTRSVAAIVQGTVIDHIPAGYGMRIVRLLHLTDHEKVVTLGLNLSSRTLGHKDIIKVEGREITPDEANQIAIFAPKATINIIRNYQIVEKFKVNMPKQIAQLLRCPNERCITNHEVTSDTRFRVHSRGAEVELECVFCEKSFSKHAY